MTVIAFVIGVLVLVVGLAVSIALHEIGHLLPAKLFGVRVGQYMIGFGPTLWSRRYGETEYGVKALPLGGYISMAGMYPPAPEGEAATGGTRRSRLFGTLVQEARAANADTLVGTEPKRAFYELSVLRRIVIMLGGPFMNLLLAVVLFAIMFSGIGVQTATPTVAAVSECVLPAGAERTECTASDPASPAAAGGILPGDVIVSVDGTPVETFADASAIIQDSPERALEIVVERDGQRRSLTVTPVLAEREIADGEGGTVVADVGFVGMTATLEYVRQPIWTGPEAAFEQVGRVVGVISQLPVRVYETAVDTFTGAGRDPDGPLSVVGAGRLAGEVAAIDAPIIDRVSTMLGLLASLNLALFVFNLVPLLPLDGGHVVIALWDGLRRAWARVRGAPRPGPTDATRLVPITYVVVVCLIAMTATLVLADIVNPVTLLG